MAGIVLAAAAAGRDAGTAERMDNISGVALALSGRGMSRCNCGGPGVGPPRTPTDAIARKECW